MQYQWCQVHIQTNKHILTLEELQMCLNENQERIIGKIEYMETNGTN